MLLAKGRKIVGEKGQHTQGECRRMGQEDAQVLLGQVWAPKREGEPLALGKGVSCSGQPSKARRRSSHVLSGRTPAMFSTCLMPEPEHSGVGTPGHGRTQPGPRHPSSLPLERRGGSLMGSSKRHQFPGCRSQAVWPFAGAVRGRPGAGGSVGRWKGGMGPLCP